MTVTPTRPTSSRTRPPSSLAGTGFDPIVANDSVTFTNGNGTVTGTVTAASATSLTVAIDPTSQLVGGNLDAAVTADAALKHFATGGYGCSGYHQRHGQPCRHAGSIVINGYGFDPTDGNDAVAFNSGAITGTVSAATPPRR